MYYNLVGKDQIEAYGLELKKGNITYWFNHKKYPFEPYKEVDNYPWKEAPKYGEAVIKQIEELYHYDKVFQDEAIADNNVKYLERTKVDWTQLKNDFENRSNIYETHPEWFI